MKLTKHFFIFLFLFGISPLVNAQSWTPPIRLIANNNLNDIAMASYSPQLQSYIIVYNPAVVASVGPLISAFFEAHEYGHIYKGHVDKGMLVSHPLQMIQLGRQAEIEADKYAAELFLQKDIAVLHAVIQYFETSGSQGDLTHLPHFSRAQLIKHYINSSGGSSNVESEENRGAIIKCNHVAHINGDLFPCKHYLNDRYGNVYVQHYYGDIFPCSHILHPEGHRDYRR
jgi:hypothetical protein